MHAAGAEFLGIVTCLHIETDVVVNEGHWTSGPLQATGTLSSYTKF